MGLVGYNAEQGVYTARVYDCANNPSLVLDRQVAESFWSQRRIDHGALCAYMSCDPEGHKSGGRTQLLIPNIEDTVAKITAVKMHEVDEFTVGQVDVDFVILGTPRSHVLRTLLQTDFQFNLELRGVWYVPMMDSRRSKIQSISGMYFIPAD